MSVSKTGLTKEQCIKELKSLNIRFRKICRYDSEEEHKSPIAAGIKPSLSSSAVDGAVSAFIPAVGGAIAIGGGIKGIYNMFSTVFSNVDFTKLYILFEFGPKCSTFSYGAWYGFTYSNYMRIQFDRTGYSIHIGKSGDYVAKFGKLKGKEDKYQYQCKGNVNGVSALVSAIEKHNHSCPNLHELQDKSNWSITWTFCSLIWDQKDNF